MLNFGGTFLRYQSWQTILPTAITSAALWVCTTTTNCKVYDARHLSIGSCETRDSIEPYPTSTRHVGKKWFKFWLNFIYIRKLPSNWLHFFFDWTSVQGACGNKMIPPCWTAGMALVCRLSLSSEAVGCYFYQSDTHRAASMLLTENSRAGYWIRSACDNEFDAPIQISLFDFPTHWRKPDRKVIDLFLRNFPGLRVFDLLASTYHIYDKI